MNAIESALGKRAIRNMLPHAARRRAATWADTRSLFDTTGYRPVSGSRKGSTALSAGIGTTTGSEANEVAGVAWLATLRSG